MSRELSSGWSGQQSKFQTSLSYTARQNFKPHTLAHSHTYTRKTFILFQRTYESIFYVTSEQAVVGLWYSIGDNCFVRSAMTTVLMEFSH